MFMAYPKEKPRPRVFSGSGAMIYSAGVNQFQSPFSPRQRIVKKF